jgi:hypothetical protein
MKRLAVVLGLNPGSRNMQALLTNQSEKDRIRAVANHQRAGNKA